MKLDLLNENTPFYHRQALDLSTRSTCSKLGYGALLVNDYSGVVMAVGHNGPLPETAHVCEPTCVRLSIPSRTNSMLGACFHAEEHVIMEGLLGGLDLRNFVVFVVGSNKGVPLVRPEPEFTCVRCASLILLSRLKGVYTFSDEYWHFQSAAEAYASAAQYAFGQKEYC